MSNGVIRIVESTTQNNSDVTQTLGDGPAWKILIVDDDPDVHEATRFALQGVEILGQKLHLISAHSSAEGESLLDENTDTAVMLLDVVMEDPNAGLTLVDRIRTRGFADLRIILRTGQPGYAPEAAIIQKYEINDYYLKDELSRSRLVTSLTTAIRTYDHLQTLKSTQTGLKKIIDGIETLYNENNLQLFAEGILTQIATLTRLTPSAAICAQSMETNDQGLSAFKILAGIGPFAENIGEPLTEVLRIDTLEQLKINTSKTIHIGSNHLLIRCEDGKQPGLLIYFRHENRFGPETASLLQLFASSLSVCYHNLTLIHSLDALAFQDFHSGIPNQNAYLKSIQHRLDRSDDHFRLAHIHLRDAGHMAAAFGSDFMDKLVQSVYQRLRASFAPSIKVAKLENTCLALVGDKEHLTGDTLNSAFKAPFEIDNKHILLNVTIALADTDDVPKTAEALDRAVRTTLLIAEQQNPGKTYCYHPDLDHEISERVHLTSALRHAVHQHQIGFSLQPKLELSTGRIVSAEALCRWNWKGVEISPSTFIPLAETCNLTLDITLQALDFVREFLDEHNKHKLPMVKIAINLSLSDFKSNDFINILLSRIDKNKLSPNHISFEITESCLLENEEKTLEMLSELKARGYSLSLDDFGTGFSSLGHLERLPIDELKIDKSFIQSLSISNARQSIAAYVQAIGQSYGFTVVAEGIETLEQHHLVSFIGSDLVQGYLYSEPLESIKLMDFVKYWDQKDFTAKTSARFSQLSH